MKINCGKLYTYAPNGWDVFDPKNAPKVAPGTVVRVMKKAPYGCPKQGTMNHYFIETVEGKFIGLVSRPSLMEMEG